MLTVLLQVGGGLGGSMRYVYGPVMMRVGDSFEFNGVKIVLRAVTAETEAAPEEAVYSLSVQGADESEVRVKVDERVPLEGTSNYYLGVDGITVTTCEEWE